MVEEEYDDASVLVIKVLNPASFLLRKESASLAALLAHAMGAWQEHRELVLSEPVRLCLARHDLYARQALRGLPSRSQLELSRWAEAHLLLSALVRDAETLPRFASHAQSSWRALARLSRVAAEVGCVEEAGFGLLTRPEELRAELQQHEATATKLQRLLGWTLASAAGVVSPGSAFAGQAAPQGCRQTRGQADASLDEAARAQRVARVRLRFGGRVTEHQLNWDEME